MTAAHIIELGLVATHCPTIVNSYALQDLIDTGLVQLGPMSKRILTEEGARVWAAIVRCAEEVV